MIDSPKNNEEINALAAKLDADFLAFNFEILPPVDFAFMAFVAGRKRRTNVVLILTTEGGSADSAFRMMRFLQSRYKHITVIVPGWCKSAGTLMCIGAHELIIGDLGELGPLDVQIVKADEMDEQKSGLVAEAAFQKLQQEAYKFFMSFVKELGASEYRVTLKTAFDIGARMTAGVVQPIFDKLDPVTIGEDYRSNRLALAYAERLNSHSRNLKRNRDLDALENLLSGYPSHGFVIDVKEAGELFKYVKPISDEMVCAVSALGSDAILPRSSRNDQAPLLEFLNDEQQPEEVRDAGADAVSSADGGNDRRRPARRNGSEDISRDTSERSRPKSAAAPNGPEGANRYKRIGTNDYA
jgi:hypothetical protein